jgi:carbon-monoxide dehydrogenase medium subunit
MMNARIARPAHLVDINRLNDLSFIRETPDTVELGALMRHGDIERSNALRRLCPILPFVAASIGHLPIRERGTIGGSLALADPAAQWPLIATLLDARIELAAAAGRRTVQARDFFLGVYTTAAVPGELLAAVAFPRRAAGEGWGYRAFTRRHGDFAIVAVAVMLTCTAAGAIERLRLALGGIGGAPVSLDTLAAEWAGRPLDHAAMQEIGTRAAAAAEPGDDVQASAELRRELIAVLTADALADALRRTRE